MEVTGAVSVSATTEVVLFSFWTHPLLAWGGGGAGLCIYALGTKAETVPEPISSGDGPLLFLNLSFLVPLFAFSRVSFWLLESLHSSSYFLFFFSSLFHRCSDFISLLSSLSLVGLSYSRISAQHPLIYNQRKLGLDLFCLRLLEFTVTTISAGPCRLVHRPSQPSSVYAFCIVYLFCSGCSTTQ